MGMSAGKRVGVCVAAVTVVAGVSGCQAGGGGAEGKAAEPKVLSRGEASEVLRTAFEKTAEAKSAKVRMTMSVPAGAQGMGDMMGIAGDGTMEMTGVQGWDPAVMDLTIKGSDVGEADPEAPSETRVIMLDDVMYADMGAEQAAETDGKRWMKLDFRAIAEEAGSEELQKQMTGSLESMNQDPAQQLALLLESPNLKHVGPQKVDGVQAQHYKGTLTFEEIIKSDGSFDFLSEEEREELVASAEKSGVKGYDTEVWVNEDDYPVRMVLGVESGEGTVEITTHYSDYGAQAEVEAPPAEDTVDLFEVLQGLEEGLADAGADV
ncbi:hypothetical protein [Streptomyces sp. NEAU-W12]|uniref:hypothetical protein n=1 Tax=Streptomyces sp. NEAU-W12 TaxID=2994668 RepID=UPI00224A7F47|nr:hypothetical protein [Streptomyces sp. NEAU-W12]MCX2926438.1 hypothetical protein [Streptomyces sp. NEAU-W12]